MYVCYSVYLGDDAVDDARPDGHHLHAHLHGQHSFDLHDHQGADEEFGLILQTNMRLGAGLYSKEIELIEECIMCKNAVKNGNLRIALYSPEKQHMQGGGGG